MGYGDDSEDWWCGREFGPFYESRSVMFVEWMTCLIAESLAIPEP